MVNAPAPAPAAGPAPAPAPAPVARLDGLAAGTAVAAIALSTRHPLPLALLLVLLLLLDVLPRPRWPYFGLAGVGALMNGLFSWYGATTLWAAPFTIAWLGRPRITVEALLAGGVTGMQIALAAIGITLALSRTPPDAIARILPGRGPRLAARLGLRALPELARDAHAMQDAMLIRGRSNAPRERAALLVPLVGRSLDRSAQSVELLYARGAGARPRPARPLRLGRPGILALVGIIGWIAVCATGSAPSITLMPRFEAGPWTDWTTWTPLFALLAIPAMREDSP